MMIHRSFKLKKKKKKNNEKQDKKNNNKKKSKDGKPILIIYKVYPLFRSSLMIIDNYLSMFRHYNKLQQLTKTGSLPSEPSPSPRRVYSLFMGAVIGLEASCSST